VPEIADLDIDDLGVGLTNSGHAAVDDYENMNVEGI
jgi:pyruvate/2-oxoglutarate dehydrogenase complex dihydrolipoamide dehydrogenase (E3) component